MPNTPTHVPAALAATAPSAKLLAAWAKASKGQDLPNVVLPEKVAFGHTYPAGTYVAHNGATVAKFLYAQRKLATKPSYRTLAELLGLQCSARAESACHAYARRTKAAQGWQVNTGARVGMVRK